MIERWAKASIRARLTGWYAAVLALTLLVYAAGTFLAVRHALREQLDERLHDDFESAEDRLTRTPDGRIVWSEEPAAHHDDQESRIFEVWSATGERIHRTGASTTLPPLALAAAATAYRYETILAGAERWRTLSAPVDVAGQSVVLRASRSEEPVRDEVREIQLMLLLGLPLVVVLAGLGGYVLARRALVPIDHLASEAQRITADRLHERLRAPNERDEIGRLASVINDTLGRLERSFDQLRRFTADASHELRTPLAAVRGIGEAAMAETRSGAEYEEAIGSMLEEVDRMSTLVDTLLRLSRGDAGTIRLSKESIDLAALTREVVGSLAVLAEERNQTIAVETGAPVIVSVDRLVLREAITNVLDNAIKYSGASATIAIQVGRDGKHARVTVADEGPGIPAEHRDRIFDRFFRVDEARSRDDGGAGLGLAIAKWAVEIHGGRITAEARPGAGSEFRIVIPMPS